MDTEVLVVGAGPVGLQLDGAMRTWFGAPDGR
jgi:threonine dehydrogenase-like Zn-dependent dehydrogenase